MPNNEAAFPNSRSAISKRSSAGELSWFGPLVMLFARPVLAIIAQGLAAAILLACGSSRPWLAAAPFLPVYGSLVDIGCLGLLWWFAKREGIRLADLIGFDRRRLAKDLLLGIALVVPGILFILAGNLLSHLIVYGSLGMPQIFEPLPLWATLYGVIVFPLLWGLTEQTTYNGYVLPRLQILFKSSGLAVIAVVLVWSAQHAVMPLTFDPKFMAYRLLSPLPFSTFIALVYLRLRRIVPLATAHWLMDGGDAFVGSLLPLLR